MLDDLLSTFKKHLFMPVHLYTQKKEFKSFKEILWLSFTAKDLRSMPFAYYRPGSVAPIVLGLFCLFLAFVLPDPFRSRVTLLAIVSFLMVPIRFFFLAVINLLFRYRRPARSAPPSAPKPESSDTRSNPPIDS